MNNISSCLFFLLCVPLAPDVNADVSSRSSTCQNGWTGYHNKCYLFVTHMLADWNEASQFCHTQNSRLAEIVDAREDNFLRQHLLDYGKQGAFWVGGNDIIIEGDWIWSLSQTPIYHYSHWIPGEPNNLGGDENCMELPYSKGYLWNDDTCSKLKFFICEQPPQGVKAKTKRKPGKIPMLEVTTSALQNDVTIIYNFLIN